MVLPTLVKTLALDKAQVAHDAGIAPATLSRITRGRQRATVATLLRIEGVVLQHLARGNE